MERCVCISVTSCIGVDWSVLEEKFDTIKEAVSASPMKRCESILEC